MKKVSIVIPARDEEETIGMVLADLKKVSHQNKKYQFEVIVVDDGSADKTGSIAKKYKAIIIRNNGQHGKGRALSLGFKHTKGEYIIILDADYSHLPEDIPRFLMVYKV